MPWNQSTILGYFGEICFILVSCESGLLVNGTIVIIFISLGLHHCAFCKLLKHIIDESNRCHRKQCNKKLLRDLVRFHATVKEYVFIAHKLLKIQNILCKSNFCLFTQQQMAFTNCRTVQSVR